jgi:hypothetical protein
LFVHDLLGVIESAVHGQVVLVVLEEMDVAHDHARDQKEEDEPHPTPEAELFTNPFVVLEDDDMVLSEKHNPPQQKDGTKKRPDPARGAGTKVDAASRELSRSCLVGRVRASLSLADTD